MKKISFSVIICLLVILNFSQAQVKDSVSFEYARVSYAGSKIRLYYENGKHEDLKKVLKLNWGVIFQDSIANRNFFIILKYLKGKGYELQTSMHTEGYMEYIFRKETVIVIPERK